jgi:hypothetical protein
MIRPDEGRLATARNAACGVGEIRAEIHIEGARLSKTNDRQ